MKLLLCLGIVTALVFGKRVNGFMKNSFDETELSLLESCGGSNVPANTSTLMVGLTLVDGAAAKGAVCLDGTPPAYHMHPGFGSGAKSWLIYFQGGAWCNDTSSCLGRKHSSYGSSALMEKEKPFDGILSNDPQQNPEFFNWNRVLLRYCDGASFDGDSENKDAQLQFRGHRIFLSATEDLMSKGMRNANQALLTGCSAGGLSTILHCDEFRGLFPSTTKVKCLSDAGFFIDAVDIAGGRTLRKHFSGVVTLQNVQENLPRFCTSHLDPTSCFFPENLISNIATPLFILNSAYDSWQIANSVAPPSVDPYGHWNSCRSNLESCSTSQMDVLYGFRDQMVNAVKQFSISNKNGMFINSCFAHCQTVQSAWFARDSPAVGSKTIAEAVADWYFDRADVKVVDGTCRHLVLPKEA